MKVFLSIAVLAALPILSFAADTWTCQGYCGGRTSDELYFVLGSPPVLGTGTNPDSAYSAAVDKCAALWAKDQKDLERVRIFSSKTKQKGSTYDTPYSVALVSDICLKN